MIHLRFAATLALSGATLLASSAAAVATPGSVTVTIRGLNGDPEGGTAKLTAVGTKTKVVVTLKHAPAGAQPAAIYVGKCATLDPDPDTSYALSYVTGGASSTTVDQPLSRFVSEGTYAIAVAASMTDARSMETCGDIKHSK